MPILDRDNRGRATTKNIKNKMMRVTEEEMAMIKNLRRMKYERNNN